MNPIASHILPDHEGKLRLAPQFFIIGERKCGSSSLFRYLAAHPLVLPGVRKEPNFFGRPQAVHRADFGKYLAQFPLAEEEEEATLIWPELDESGQLYEVPVTKARQAGIRYLTGEASANTFCDADPALVKQFLPDVRLIVILRDPVERAFSHHRMLLRFQEEGRELGRKIKSFEEDIEQEMMAEGAGECLAPGKYIDNLQRWDAVFPASQRLVLFASELDEHPQRVMDAVLAHIGLPAWTYLPEDLRVRYNVAPASSCPAHLRTRLRAFYEPSNARLATYLGQELPW